MLEICKFFLLSYSFFGDFVLKYVLEFLESVDFPKTV